MQNQWICRKNQTISFFQISLCRVVGFIAYKLFATSLLIFGFSRSQTVMWTWCMSYLKCQYTWQVIQYPVLLKLAVEPRWRWYLRLDPVRLSQDIKSDQSDEAMIQRLTNQTKPRYKVWLSHIIKSDNSLTDILEYLTKLPLNCTQNIFHGLMN